MTAADRPTLAYRAELDGVRAVAVLAVLGYHVSYAVPWFAHLFRGGFLGVDVFFVLSGMLITDLLVTEQMTHRTVSLRGFYRRRALRLLPALVVVLVVMTAYYQLADHTGRATLSGLVSMFTYVTFGHVRGPFPQGISQIWTLIVEWEFYLIWPIALVALLRRRISLRSLGYAAAVAALTLTVVRALVFHFGGDDWPLSYYLAWLRFDELLVGCAVGLLGFRPQAPSWLRLVGFAAILAAITQATYPAHWLYLGGMILLATSTAIVVQPRRRPVVLDRFLSSPPMVWTGKLSYSLYLWSVPVVTVVGHHSQSWPAGVRVVAFVVGSFGFASASYYVVERRFRLPSRQPLAPASPADSAEQPDRTVTTT